MNLPYPFSEGGYESDLPSALKHKERKEGDRKKTYSLLGRGIWQRTQTSFHLLVWLHSRTLVCIQIDSGGKEGEGIFSYIPWRNECGHTISWHLCLPFALENCTRSASPHGGQQEVWAAERSRLRHVKETYHFTSSRTLIWVMTKNCNEISL